MASISWKACVPAGTDSENFPAPHGKHAVRNNFIGDRDNLRSGKCLGDCRCFVTVLQQAGVAALAQANQSNQAVLSLLKW